MSKKIVLVIDDEIDFCKFLKLNLDRTGEYDCMIATSGEVGLEFVKLHKPDLVLLDIMMPGMDGVETLKQIKAIDKEIDVCMVTAVWDNAEGRRCFEAEAYDYITKPVDFEHLRKVLFVKLLDLRNRR